MSTEALREALERMRFDSMDGEERQLYRDARAELAAIEQAAKDFVRLGGGEFVKITALSDLLVLMDSIAKEAK